MNDFKSDDPQDLLAHINISFNDDMTVNINFSGHWTAYGKLEIPIEQLLKTLSSRKPQKIVLNAFNVERWDSRLPVYILNIFEYCEEQKITVESQDLPNSIQNLLQLACAVPERTGVRRATKQYPLVQKLGKSVLSFFSEGYSLLAFIGEVMLSLWALLFHRARFRTIDLLLFIQDTGVSALAIVSLISLLVGLILAFVGSAQLSLFGAQIYIANLVGLGTVREMGALMTAIIISGRTGAAYAAQLGTMNVNLEIDALKTMGISPIEFLVLPRLLALVLMMPLLGLYADLLSILGGAIVTVSAFDVSLLQYYNQTIHSVRLVDLGIGFFKCIVFALLIATAGCLRGLKCGRSASAVGEAATSAVVDSIVYIVVADSLIALICQKLGI